MRILRVAFLAWAIFAPLAEAFVLYEQQAAIEANAYAIRALDKRVDQMQDDRVPRGVSWPADITTAEAR